MDESDRLLRVMADANVLIAGLLFPRWFHEFLQHALRNDFRLVLTAYTIEEACERMAKGTNDKDLTAQDETTAVLRQRLQPIIVGRFLKEVMGWESDELEKIRRRNWSDMPVAGTFYRVSSRPTLTATV